MMNNKLSELTNNARKAANSFYNWSQLANCTSERVSCLTVEQLKEVSELFSALLAELEAKDKRIAELERSRFIAWPGNMFAPVLARIRVDVKRRDGSASFGLSGGNVIWCHQDRPDDVVAFALAVEGDE